MSKQGSVAPKERINIKYVPATGDQQAEVELPLKLLVTGDFKGHGETQPLEERQAVRIDKNTFDAVMEKANLALTMNVPCRLDDTDDTTDESTIKVGLSFRSMRDFEPDAIAHQVPELRKLVALREALVALKGPLGNMPAFRQALQNLLADEATRDKLAQELQHVLAKQPS